MSDYSGKVKFYQLLFLDFYTGSQWVLDLDLSTDTNVLSRGKEALGQYWGALVLTHSRVHSEVCFASLSCWTSHNLQQRPSFQTLLGLCYKTSVLSCQQSNPKTALNFRTSFTFFPPRSLKMDLQSWDCLCLAWLHSCVWPPQTILWSPSFSLSSLWNNDCLFHTKKSNSTAWISIFPTTSEPFY